MKKVLGIFFTLILAFSANADNIGDWKLYLSYHDALNCQPVGDEMYVNFGGNLLTYHPEDEEVRMFSRLDGLNSRNIKLMGYSAIEKCLILVYEDKQIDLFYPEDGCVVGLPQIKNTGMDGVGINSIMVDGENAVIGTGNGVALINLERQEVTGYYVLNKNVRTVTIYGNELYAGTDEGVFTCSLDDNPMDLNSWKIKLKANFSKLVLNGHLLYGIVDKATTGGFAPGLWLLQGENSEFQKISNAVFTHIDVCKGNLVVADNNRLLSFNGDNPAQADLRIQHKNNWNHVVWGEDGNFWACDGMNGFQAYAISSDTLVKVGPPIGHYGPRRDLCYYMNYVSSDRLLIAGGRLDPYDRLHYPGVIMEYSGGEWKYCQDERISWETGVPYRDITSVIADPDDPSHIIASAGGTGIYEFRDYVFTEQYSIKNSPLESAAGKEPKYVRVDGLSYDEAGNLWMVNNTQRDTILRARRPDGTWKSFYVEQIKNAPTCEKTFFDQHGRLWVASRRTVENHNGGLLCFDYNKTFDNTSDDIATYRYNFENQDGKSYKVMGVCAMAEDRRDGSIWVGTLEGLFVLDNPEDWSDPDYQVTQIKIPRNDGTNLADYLLDDIPISAIAIDGAGRKWIGTASNGIYLVSNDRLRVLKHFTVDNSPLLSNSIYSIAPNMDTGEIMIGTDEGLCSYMSAATTPETALDENRIKVFPNPVRPEYHGVIRVKGMTDNAEVKVMSASGEVIARGTSTGGTFVWDGKRRDGSRVAAGVYYFMVSTSDGGEGIASKIVVI